VKFLDATTAFIRYCAHVRKLSSHTVRAYQLDLARFAEYVGHDASVASCSRTVVQEYVSHLFEKRRMHAASVKRHLATLRALFRWLEDDRGAPDNPFRGMRFGIRVPRRLPRVIPRSDLRRMLRDDFVAAGGTFRSLTAYVAIEILFATGIRVGELAALPDRAVNLDDATITIVGKGDRQRRVFVPDEVAALLRHYQAERSRRAPHAASFLVNAHGAPTSPQLLRRLVRAFGERCAVRDPVTPHMFRHSVATYLLEEGVDIRYVQRLLGHRSISTTEIYTHVADESLKQRIIERHPRRRVTCAESRA
jgi:site-specific recombinase XerD